MAVYITGGSTTATTGSWADAFAARVARKHAVRNLALGATNSVMAFCRLFDEVSLAPGDTVIWSNAANDALCLENGFFADGALVRYVEEAIRLCARAGARFIPLVMDTYSQLIQVRQTGYRDALIRLFEHYRLIWVDVGAIFFAETGLETLPREFFSDNLHLRPGGEFNDFVADLAHDALETRFGPPPLAPPLYADPTARHEVIAGFGPAGQERIFESRSARFQTWLPPVSVVPVAATAAAPAELVAMTVIADPESGAFDLKVGERRLCVSATHWFRRSGRPIALTILPRNLLQDGVFISPGESLHLDWCNHDGPHAADMYFRERVAPAPRGASEARLVSLLLRHSGPE